ncbi:RNA-dependent RNA polymerase [Shahe narna-like virus 3]|uniref:RNA-dependent RNA polymerase n=1 Tax=Shahe narna-like virus 3 TaxID=1923431 RepID=UPI00090C95A6|nr:RNA-dependent RNA polymerase [Shahe narna-like virus 3]APG77164.1 RNA-dependent RNA polymerase [Shahe narna-like virus 3]
MFLKRSLAPVPRSLIKKSRDDHKSTLTTPSERVHDVTLKFIEDCTTVYTRSLTKCRQERLEKPAISPINQLKRLKRTYGPIEVKEDCLISCEDESSHRQLDDSSLSCSETPFLNLMATKELHNTRDRNQVHGLHSLNRSFYPLSYKIKEVDQNLNTFDNCWIDQKVKESSYYDKLKSDTKLTEEGEFISQQDISMSKYSLDKINKIYPLSKHSSYNNSVKIGGAQSEISLNLQNSNLKLGSNNGGLRKFAMLNNAMKNQYEIAKAKCLNESKDIIKESVRVCSIVEPLKVRTVTAEEARNQFIKPIQKLLWEDLLSHEDFFLTRNEDFESHWNRKFKFCDLPYHISGDYKAATDNLNRNVINVVITQLSTLLPTNLIDLFMKNAGLHYLDYNEVAFSLRESPDKIGDVYLQKNGQLMGSLTSFPLLCFINWISYQFSKYLVNNYPDEHLSESCAINGDDIYFKASLKGYAKWQEVVHSFGLSPSPGKNYSSSNCFLINSRNFLVNTKSELKEIPFINFQMLPQYSEDSNNKFEHNKKELLNQMKGDSVYSEVNSPIGIIFRTFCKQANINLVKPSKFDIQLIYYFYSVWKKEIIKCPREFYLPSLIGGMGALTLDEFKKTNLLTKTKKLSLLRGFKCKSCFYMQTYEQIGSDKDQIESFAAKLENIILDELSGTDPENKQLSSKSLLSPVSTFVSKGGVEKYTLQKFFKKLGKSSFRNRKFKPATVLSIEKSL